jgi:hypothetical protein
MIERISWHGWNDVYRMWNGTVQLLVLADVGPRIIWYGFQEGENVLHEVVSDLGSRGGNQFRLYGGHRLWVSPEVERTYFPDNRPVTVEYQDNRARFTAPVEDAAPGTNLQKELEVELEETGSSVHVRHRVINHDNQPTKLAPWAPTMMKAGGRAILPLPPRISMDKDHYRPVGPLTLWSFTDLADPRWRWGTEYIQLIQQTNPNCQYEEQMTGIFNPAGWGAYFWTNSLFIKRAPVIAGAVYPDFGCNFEVFTNREFLELETLGPKTVLSPAHHITHEETWQLFRDVSAGEDEEWIRSVLLPLVKSQ